MGTLSDRAAEKLSGPSWDPLRETFTRINNALLGVSPDAFGELTTIYIKYAVSNVATAAVYAVVWIKSAKQLVVGMALPADVSHPELVPPPHGTKYKGLTGYLVLKPGDIVPANIELWAKSAFEAVSSVEESKMS
jgi:hypothetical protein